MRHHMNEPVCTFFFFFSNIVGDVQWFTDGIQQTKSIGLRTYISTHVNQLFGLHKSKCFIMFAWFICFTFFGSKLHK